MQSNQRVEKLWEKTGCRLVQAVELWSCGSGGQIQVVSTRGFSCSFKYPADTWWQWQLSRCFSVDIQIKKQTMENKHRVKWISTSHVIACSQILSLLNRQFRSVPSSGGTCLNLVFCPTDCWAIVICVNIRDLAWNIPAVWGVSGVLEPSPGLIVGEENAG